MIIVRLLFMDWISCLITNIPVVWAQARAALGRASP